MLVNATKGKLSQKLPKEVSPSLKILEQYLENGLGKRKRRESILSAEDL